MPLPLAIQTLLQNARQEIIVSQIISAVIGVLLGPGCLLLSVLPVDASSEYRVTLRIGGAIVCLLLGGLVLETRRKLARTDRILNALNQTPEEIASILPFKEKGGGMGSYRVLIELKDSTTETLPVAEQDYNILLGYLRSKFPSVLREISNRR